MGSMQPSCHIFPKGVAAGRSMLARSVVVATVGRNAAGVAQGFAVGAHDRDC